MPHNQTKDLSLYPFELMTHIVKLHSFVLPKTGFAVGIALLFSFLGGLGTQKATAQTQVINFENNVVGEIVEYVTASEGYSGIKITGEHPSCPLRNAAVIFDSSCPGGCSGDDDDLGTPNTTFGGPGIGAGGEAGSGTENDTALGNILIVHQNCSDLGNSPVADPRDFGGTDVILITFPTDVTIFSLTTLDVESSESLQIDFIDKNDVVVGFANPVVTGNNGKAVLTTIPVGSSGNEVSGIRTIEVTRQGSGALDDIVFAPDAMADLELTKIVDNPAPDSGAAVTFTLELTNQGPDAATNVAVKDRVPNGLNLVSHTCDGIGTIEVGEFVNDEGETQQSVSATIDEIASGEILSCTVTVTVDTEKALENVAEVVASDAYDPDSTPGNNVLDEDDQDAAAVTPGGSSGGGNGGIESDGNMATHLARRLFNRRIDAQQQTALMAAPQPVVFVPAVQNAAVLAKAGSGLDDLRDAIPVEGPHTTLAYEVTPRDLLQITNATGVLAVDYLQLDGRRLGAIFSTTSPDGELYDHTKASCDRLGGGMLEDVRLVEINGHPFVLSKLHHANGDIDYAISFVAYRSGAGYVIDSRFSPDEYDVPAASEVINIQVWGVSPEFSEEIVGNLLNELDAAGPIEYNNSATQAPQIFVVNGEYSQGKLTLRLANKVGATQVRIRGTVSETEADAERSLRIPFEHTVSLNEPAAGHLYSEVSLNVGSIFDATLVVDHGDSESHDQLYHADGAWSYASGDESEISTFKTATSKQVYSFDRYVVERSGSLSGKVKNWVSLFRYLQPAGRPVDLTDYKYLSFTASGHGQIRLIAEKESIDNWDQYGFTLALTPEPKRYKINFSEFRKEATFDGPFSAEDVTLLAFYSLGDGQTAKDFSINVDDVTFGGSLVDEMGEVPSLYALEQNFPNPFNPVTQISYALVESMNVRLAVYDMLGREIAVLVDGLQAAGTHELTFHAVNLPSGLYMYRIETPEGSTAKMMSLLK